MPTIKQLKERLDRYEDENMVVVADIWFASDIQHNNDYLTEEQANEVIEYLDSKCCDGQGIDQDVIEYAIEQLGYADYD